jgi:hypothetical protein
VRNGISISDAPHAASAAILAGLADLRVVLDAGGRGAEDDGVLAVVEGVEQDLDGVGVEQIAVAPVLCHHDPVLFGIETNDADIDVVVVVSEANLSALRGWAALIRVALSEVACRRNELPKLFVDQAVERGRVLDPHSPGGTLVSLLAEYSDHKGDAGQALGE